MFLRSASRSLLVVGIIIIAWLAFSLRGLGSPQTKRRDKSLWLHRWCRRLIYLIGLKPEVHGRPPESGLMISNHLGYLDIIALSSVFPCVFVAKKEINGWPVFGALARMGGTIFVDREKAAALKPTLEEVEFALAEGLTVVLFAEGTSSGGESVLPFRSPLLQAAINRQCLVTPSSVDYQVSQGSVMNEVCYWRDMTLIPHLWNLLSKKSIVAILRFSPSQPAGSDRKTLAPRLRSEVLALRGKTAQEQPVAALLK